MYGSCFFWPALFTTAEFPIPGLRVDALGVYCLSFAVNGLIMDKATDQ